MGHIAKVDSGRVPVKHIGCGQGVLGGNSGYVRRPVPDPIFALTQAGAGISVRILDLSGANGAEPVEEVRGFGSLGHANTFARRYVRDSIERLPRPRPRRPAKVLETWFAFGEDAEVTGAAEGAWSSKTELKDFSERPLREGEQRDWRAIDPRRAVDEEEE